MRYRVIGLQPVGGVSPGGEVELDPSVTNIGLLLGRHIEEIAAPVVDESESTVTNRPKRESKPKGGE